MGMVMATRPMDTVAGVEKIYIRMGRVMGRRQEDLAIQEAWAWIVRFHRDLGRGVMDTDREVLTL
jgi:hypothetical protein